MNKKHLLLWLTVLCGATTVSAQETDNPLPDWAFGGFVRPEGVNPIITANENSTFFCPMKNEEVKWECADTFNPAAVVKDGKIYVLYRAEDDPNVGIGNRTSRIGLAEMNEDGITVSNRLTEPVFYPTDSELSKSYEWDGGCEDPRVVLAEVDGKPVYVMTYTAWSRNHDGIPRLSIAMSEDLLKWETKGPAFLTAYDGKFKNNHSKSGSIVTKVVDGVQKAVKVNFKGEDKYLMYWGEDAVFLATSDDLINWTPYVNENKDLIRLIVPRPNHFDSNLTECGPPAVITDKGILLLYNGKNKSDYLADENYPVSTYAAGQVLFSLDDPTNVVNRLDNAFFRPMADFEKTGQYKDGTVFIEGLVYNNGKWYLYYGCADSMVGVAVYDPENASSFGDPVEGQVETDKFDHKIINAVPKDLTGKVRCRIYDKSGQTNDNESALFLNLGHAVEGKKWCENQSDHPWVIWEFFDYYMFDGFGFNDARVHEPNSQNQTEYKLEVSMDGNEWTEVLHMYNVGDQNVKKETFEPVEGRFVKATFEKVDGAARIYGADIYGEFSRTYERADNNISIGKTILAAYDHVSPKEAAHNLLTGTYDSKESKWCFYAADINSDPVKYVVIDLEDNFDISGFRILDCKQHEPESPNTEHYKISVATEAPNLSLISPVGDSNACWTPVVTKFDDTETNKEDNLESPVEGRYVKLEVPRVIENGKEYNTDTHRIYAFDVYGEKNNIITGVGSISVDEAAAPVKYFDLMGRPVNESKTGIYVKVQGSKTTKVFLK